jgi:hypothetical protein
MLSTSGELLCFCDMRKLQWYVDRGLAERVLQDPPTIRLLFEHKNADQQVGFLFSCSKSLLGCTQAELYIVIQFCDAHWGLREPLGFYPFPV